MSWIWSCLVLSENIIIADFTYLFPSAGLPSRTSSSSTYFVCPWFFQMSAVSFFYFSLEAIKAMHITKLQTFSTGNRTLKREVYFITLLKNLKVIRKPEEAMASPKMDSMIIGIISVLWHNIYCTYLKFLCKLSLTEHYWSDAKHPSRLVHSLISSSTNTWAPPSVSMQETAWYYDLTRTCSSSLLLPYAYCYFHVSTMLVISIKERKMQNRGYAYFQLLGYEVMFALAPPFHELWVSCCMWQRGKRRGIK